VAGSFAGTSKNEETLGMSGDIGDLLFVDCLGSPREMGRQYGEAAREGILSNRGWWQTERRAAEGGERIAHCGEFLRDTVPDIHEELLGIAEGSGVPFGEILMFNQCDAGTRPVGCTSMALLSGSDGPLVAKNNDGCLGDSGRFVIRRSRPTRGLPMVQVTYAGWVSGLDAMNAEGVATVHSSVGSAFPRPHPSLDIRLRAYQALRGCSNTGDFLAALGSRPLTGKGFNIVVGDVLGDTCVVEAAVPVLARRGRGETFVFTTNHYITSELVEADQRTPEGKEISVYRLGYLKWIKAQSQPQTISELQGLLRSHDPWGVCRHGGPHKSRTLWSMVAQCESGEILVCDGFPCEGEYQSVGF
jgi:hypothetical protein